MNGSSVVYDVCELLHRHFNDNFSFAPSIIGEQPFHLNWRVCRIVYRDISHHRSSELISDFVLDVEAPTANEIRISSGYRFIVCVSLDFASGRLNRLWGMPAAIVGTPSILSQAVLKVFPGLFTERDKLFGCSFKISDDGQATWPGPHPINESDEERLVRESLNRALAQVPAELRFRGTLSS